MFGNRRKTTTDEFMSWMVPLEQKWSLYGPDDRLARNGIAMAAFPMRYDSVIGLPSSVRREIARLNRGIPDRLAACEEAADAVAVSRQVLEQYRRAVMSVMDSYAPSAGRNAAEVTEAHFRQALQGLGDWIRPRRKTAAPRHRSAR